MLKKRFWSKSYSSLLLVKFFTLGAIVT